MNDKIIKILERIQIKEDKEYAVKMSGASAFEKMGITAHSAGYATAIADFLEEYNKID